MGITFIVSGFAFALCHWNCNCTDLNASGNVYLGFFLVLGIVLTSLAGVLVSNVSGKGKGWAVTTLVFGVLFIVSCIGFMMYKHKDKISSNLVSLYQTKPLAFAFY